VSSVVSAKSLRDTLSYSRDSFLNEIRLRGSLADKRPIVRRLSDLRPVLFDRDSCAGMDPNLPVYEIYRDMCHGEGQSILAKNGLRYDVTVMPPLLLGEEYTKTLGHYHQPCGEAGSHPEIFEVLEGEAHFLLQKPVRPEFLEVSCLAAKEGEKVLIPSDRGHVMINASSGRLVTGNLISKSCVQTYAKYMERRGAAFYVLSGGRLVRNPCYPEMPEIRPLKADTTFLEVRLGLVEAFLKNPDWYRFLNGPDKFAQQRVIS